VQSKQPEKEKTQIMRAITLESFDSSPDLHEIPIPQIAPNEVLDRDADVAALVRERYPEGIEALLDLVSYAPEGFGTHAEVLKNDGRGASALSAAGEGSERHDVGAVPTPENLQRLARLLEAGTLRVPIQKTYELDQGGDALRELATEHAQGKCAIRVAQ
jgi:NADPH:quinone reductase-like Zn-dependent oxidoreductase